MCPLLFGLGVELDKTFGSKWLVDHISRLGYCISYDEVLRYKQSVVESMDGTENMDESCNFTHWVTDNVDRNINTLTGKGTFHSMGIISVTQPGKITSDKLVTRTQKRKKTSEVIKNKGIKIQSFLGSSSKGLSNIKLKPMRQLITSCTFFPKIKYNISWPAGWFTSSPENP